MTADKSSWSPGEVFRDDPAAERGFDENAIQSAIDDYAARYGILAAVGQLAIANSKLASAASGISQDESTHTHQADRTVASMLQQVIEGASQHIHFAGIEIRDDADGRSSSMVKPDSITLSRSAARALVQQHRALAYLVLRALTHEPALGKNEMHHMLWRTGYAAEKPQ